MASLIKFFPRWLRIAIAWVMVMLIAKNEYGGTLYNFLGKGDLERLHKWENDQELEQAWAMLKSERESGRDFVWVGAVKTGPRQGYMFVHSSKRFMWSRGFIPGIYEPMAAYIDAMELAKKDAKELGWRLDYAGGNDEQKVHDSNA